MSDLPAPEKTEACLPSVGLNYTRATRHTFSHAEEVPYTDADGKPDGSVYAFVYKCTETGAARRWGFAP